jgi:hypothetical protein
VLPIARARSGACGVEGAARRGAARRGRRAGAARGLPGTFQAGDHLATPALPPPSHRRQSSAARAAATSGASRRHRARCCGRRRRSARAADHRPAHARVPSGASDSSTVPPPPPAPRRCTGGPGSTRTSSRTPRPRRGTARRCGACPRHHPGRHREPDPPPRARAGGCDPRGHRPSAGLPQGQALRCPRPGGLRQAAQGGARGEPATEAPAVPSLCRGSTGWEGPGPAPRPPAAACRVPDRAACA